MYKALLFHPEGDFVTDAKDSKSIQDVWDQVADFGSRWVFYPIAFVATDKTVVDTPEGLEFLKGRRIKTVANYLHREWQRDADWVCDGLNEGVPYGWIYSPF